jgi:phosphoglycerate dehydrogenase-like enzyme
MPTVLSTVEELQAALADCVYLLMGRPPRMDYGRAGRLELLQIAGAGVDPLFPAVGLRAAAVVANCRGLHADGVRDHVLGLLLAFARDLPGLLAQQSRREWRAAPKTPVTGKHLVLLGYGAIGSRVATAARGLGMVVSAVRRTLGEVPGLERVYAPEQLALALGQADFFVIAAPLTSHTRGMVGERALSALPERAVVINVSRGGVLDEVALEQRLRDGRLSGAALDVFEREPLAESSALWACPRLLITPHVAGYEPEYLPKVFEMFAENVQRLRRGEAVKHVVSRENEY